MKIRLLLALAAVSLGSTVFALTDGQKASITAAINGANPAALASVAAAQLKANAPGGESDALAFILQAAKAKLGANPSRAAVRALVNQLVLAAPTRAGAIVQAAATEFPAQKANIASGAQDALKTAKADNQITAAQANALSGQVNAAAGVASSSGKTGISALDQNAAAAAAAARTELARATQNNYSAP
ncbi:MAG: hypothetical protein RLZZ15_1289 [Verrucomicrobiota bacterium]|jgi:hypothetical protein